MTASQIAAMLSDNGFQHAVLAPSEETRQQWVVRILSDRGWQYFRLPGDTADPVCRVERWALGNELGQQCTTTSSPPPTDWSTTFERFGAVGDGTTDDYEAIQSALDWAYDRGGAVIYPDRKVYAVSKTPYLWPRVRIAGITGAWTNQYSNGLGSAAPVPLGSAIMTLPGANCDAMQARFRVFNDGGALREIGSNRPVQDFRHHGGAHDVTFWGNRSGKGVPPTAIDRNSAGSGFSVYGARYLYLERCSALFNAENGFEFLARDYTADFGAGGVIGSNNQRVMFCAGHSNAQRGFLHAMYDSIMVGNDAGYNGLDGFAGYWGSGMTGNASWNNLRRGFTLGIDSGYATTSATSASFSGNHAYDNEWGGFWVSGHGAPIVTGCFARGNGRDTSQPNNQRANYVLTSTARGGGFVGCQSAAWDYDGTTPITHYGFLISNPSFKTAFAGNQDRGSTVPLSISNPANIIAAQAVN